MVALRPFLGRCLLWVRVCALHHRGFPGPLVPAPSAQPVISAPGARPGTAARMRPVLCLFPVASKRENQSSQCPPAGQTDGTAIPPAEVRPLLIISRHCCYYFLPYRLFFLYVYFSFMPNLSIFSFCELLNFVPWLETTIPSQYYFKSSSFLLVILCFYFLFESLLCMEFIFRVRDEVGLPWWLSGEESACDAEDAGDPGSIPGSGRSPEEGHGDPLQYSCLETPMDRGTWWATVHGFTESEMIE